MSLAQVVGPSAYTSDLVRVAEQVIGVVKYTIILSAFSTFVQPYPHEIHYFYGQE